MHLYTEKNKKQPTFIPTAFKIIYYFNIITVFTPWQVKEFHPYVYCNTHNF